MQRSSRAWLAFTMLAFVMAFGNGTMLAAQTAAAFLSPGTPRTIVLPDEIPAGESATLAVLDAMGQLVPNATVQLSSGARVTTDSTGRALFLASPQGGMLTAQLQNGPSFTTNVAGGTRGQEVQNVLVVRSPEIVALADRFAVHGSGLHPDASRNRVLLGGQTALVLASSSVCLIVLPNPGTPVGKTELSVEVAGRSPVRTSAVVVSLAVMGPTQELAKGKKGAVQITVSGTKEKLLVEVRNLSPEVVEFPRGDMIRLKTSGGTNNVAKIDVVGEAAGDYAVSARFVSVAEAAEGAR